MPHLLAEVQHPEGLKKDGGFYAVFSWNPEPKEKYCLCLNSWQTVAAPLILSPVIQKAMSRDPKLSSNWTETTAGERLIFFLLYISAFMFASTLTLYVTVFSSSYSVTTNNSRSKMSVEKHRANRARSTTASHTIHEKTKKTWLCFPF